MHSLGKISGLECLGYLVVHWNVILKLTLKEYNMKLCCIRLAQERLQTPIIVSMIIQAGAVFTDELYSDRNTSAK
jgi:hypothetical protein